MSAGDELPRGQGTGWNDSQSSRTRQVAQQRSRFKTRTQVATSTCATLSSGDSADKALMPMRTSGDGRRPHVFLHGTRCAGACHLLPARSRAVELCLWLLDTCVPATDTTLNNAYHLSRTSLLGAAAWGRRESFMPLRLRSSASLQSISIMKAR